MYIALCVIVPVPVAYVIITMIQCRIIGITLAQWLRLPWR